MSLQTITITLPETTFQRLLRRSSFTRRSVADEAARIVATALPAEEKIPSALESELSRLEQFTDGELWQVAQSKATFADETTMQELLDKQQREGLSVTENKTAHALSREFNRIMLMRAKAAVLLKTRGHDISPLATSLSTE